MSVRTMRATLVTDGTSDRILVNVLRWILHVANIAADVQFADLATLSVPPKGILERSRAAMKLYPADVLFIHRDAEAQGHEARYDEISAALTEETLRYVSVVPVRMTEAWFLFDEKAIRTAASNPNGRAELRLPRLDRVEFLPNPKEVLHEALREASELSSHRKARFRVAQAVQRLGEIIEDFGALRRLPSFDRLCAEARAACAAVKLGADGD